MKNRFGSKRYVYCMQAFALLCSTALSSISFQYVVHAVQPYHASLAGNAALSYVSCMQYSLLKHLFLAIQPSPVSIAYSTALSSVSCRSTVLSSTAHTA